MTQKIGDKVLMGSFLEEAPASAVDSIHRETGRQALHMLVGAFALLLRWLSYPLALLCAAAAVAFNLFLLPRLPGSKQRLYRPHERERGFSTGILMYPAAVFTLILLFPTPVAAAIWGVLSFGDGMATIVGTRVRRRRPLPWNPAKSLEGLVAFVVFAAPAAIFLYWWTAPNAHSSPPWWRSEQSLELFGALSLQAVILVSLATAGACSILETLRLGLDDNVVVPLGGAVFMVGLTYVLFL